MKGCVVRFELGDLVEDRRSRTVVGLVVKTRSSGSFQTVVVLKDTSEVSVWSNDELILVRRRR